MNFIPFRLHSGQGRIFRPTEVSPAKGQKEKWVPVVNIKYGIWNTKYFMCPQTYQQAFIPQKQSTYYNISLMLLKSSV